TGLACGSLVAMGSITTWAAAKAMRDDGGAPGRTGNGPAALSWYSRGPPENGNKIRIGSFLMLIQREFRDIYPSPLSPGTQSDFRQLHPTRSLQKAVGEGRVLEHVLEKHLPLNLEGVVVLRSRGNRLPAVQIVGGTGHVGIPDGSGRLHRPHHPRCTYKEILLHPRVPECGLCPGTKRR